MTTKYSVAVAEQNLADAIAERDAAREDDRQAYADFCAARDRHHAASHRYKRACDSVQARDADLRRERIAASKPAEPEPEPTELDRLHRRVADLEARASAAEGKGE